MFKTQPLRSFSKSLKYSILRKSDPTIYKLIKSEEKRQLQCINLIASENYTSFTAMEPLSTCLTNKYSEGYPGARFYGGTEIIDKIEKICQKRALEAFGLNPENWGVNVQAYSGSIANLAIFSALLKNQGKVMGLELSSGGHLSHGYYRQHKNINCTSRFFSSLSYGLDPETELVDFKGLENLAHRFCPGLIIMGGSAYPRDWEYSKFRAIADKVGALLLADISHYSGLVASKLLKNPFDHSDVVMSTTHKTLAGPRGALIFYKLGLKQKIDFAVFPHIQGGPHNNNIAGIAAQLECVRRDEFKTLSTRTIANAKAMAHRLMERGHTLQTNGTDTHLILWNVAKHNVSGAIFEAFLDKIHIILNKNTLPGDTSALNPSGVRIGTAAVTSRGMREAQVVKISDILADSISVLKNCLNRYGVKECNDLNVLLNGRYGVGLEEEMKSLRERVLSLTRGLGAPGIE